MTRRRLSSSTARAACFPSRTTISSRSTRAAAGDTASLIFQTGYSGRAELGTTGDDDFHVKVSNDGSGWHEAIVIARDSGAVSFPATALPAPNCSLIINPQMVVNQRNFAGGALAAGTYGYDRWKAGASALLSLLRRG